MGCGAGQSASPTVTQPIKADGLKVETKASLAEQKSPSPLKTSARDQKDKLNTSKPLIGQAKPIEIKKTSVGLTKSPSSEKNLGKSVSV
jgi:AmiR/NasT family two-component response regulator